VTHTSTPGLLAQRCRKRLDAVIVGGGFGGLLAAARLQEAGITNIRILEKAGDFVGTWYWNRYPGAQCDIESYIYLPLLEETGFVPKEKYSFAPEIFAHAERIGRNFNLYERTCFQTQSKRRAGTKSKGAGGLNPIVATSSRHAL
jgi:cyclohexanone monooxygenase